MSLFLAQLKWQTERRVAFERELQDRLANARNQWRSNELEQALDDAKQEWQKQVLGDFPTVRKGFVSPHPQSILPLRIQYTPTYMYVAITAPYKFSMVKALSFFHHILRII